MLDGDNNETGDNMVTIEHDNLHNIVHNNPIAKDNIDNSAGLVRKPNTFNELNQEQAKPTLPPESYFSTIKSQSTPIPATPKFQLLSVTPTLSTNPWSIPIFKEDTNQFTPTVAITQKPRVPKILNDKSPIIPVPPQSLQPINLFTPQLTTISTPSPVSFSPASKIPQQDVTKTHVTSLPSQPPSSTKVVTVTESNSIFTADPVEFRPSPKYPLKAESMKALEYLLLST